MAGSARGSSADSDGSISQRTPSFLAQRLSIWALLSETPFRTRTQVSCFLTSVAPHSWSLFK